MNRKILAIVLMLSLSMMLVIVPAGSSAGIPNQDTITYATIGGPDATGGSDPAWAYDTSSEEMLQQVYEPLFMYVNTSLTLFKPMLADNWNGLVPDANGNGGFIVPLHPAIPAELAVITAAGITPPAGTEEVWLFHIRNSPAVQWQNASYGTVKPSDVAYSIQRGLLQDAISGVQWMMYGPLLGAGDSTHWDTNHNGVIDASEYNGASGLGNAVKNCIQANDGTMYLAFFLPAPYAPFMQILTQGWAFVTCKAWVIAHGGIDTSVALSNNANNYTEFSDHYKPDLSPLMEPSVVGDPNFPMMGTGPYILKVYDTDPHVGFERFQRNTAYWQGWAAHPYAEYIVIKIVEEWSNRKFQFLSTSSTQCDFTDVPRANAGELHVNGINNQPTLPGIRLQNVSQQIADYYFYNYHVAAGSAFMPQLGGVDKPDLLSDRDLREAFMYVFDDALFLSSYWKGEAFQPTTFMCQGTAFYNATIPVRQYNINQAIAHLQLAWGGQVWTQGISVKLVYNIGNTARQTIATMIQDAFALINTQNGTSLNVVADGEPWGTYLPAMNNKQLTCFTVGWLADYPDPDDWAAPFMASYGSFAGRQSVNYGQGLASLNAAYTSAVPKLTWGQTGLPYTGSLGDHVTGLNNSYVDYLIQTATGLGAGARSNVYNELMDIYYVEAASMPTDQGIGRHYERDWIHGWVGGYSNSPVAVGHYFYQIWKALPTPTTPIYGVGLDATTTIANTSFVPFLMIAGTHQIDINYTVHAAYTNTTVTPLVIYAAFGLYRVNYFTGEVTFIDVATFTISRGSSTTVSLTWSTDDLPADGLYVIGFRAVPIGAAGSVIYPASENKLAVNHTIDVHGWVQIGYSSNAQVPGDLGARIGSVNRFYAYDNQVTSADLFFELLCYHGLGPNGALTAFHWTPP
jgi:peptide/nickel transport system substrate-binding protein